MDRGSPGLNTLAQPSVDWVGPKVLVLGPIWIYNLSRLKLGRRLDKMIDAHCPVEPSLVPLKRMLQNLILAV